MTAIAKLTAAQAKLLWYTAQDATKAPHTSSPAKKLLEMNLVADVAGGLARISGKHILVATEAGRAWLDAHEGSHPWGALKS